LERVQLLTRKFYDHWFSLLSWRWYCSLSKIQKNKKNQNLQKKEEKRRKGKVEGLVWKPSKTFPINTMLHWIFKRGAILIFGGERQHKNRTLNLSLLQAAVWPTPLFFDFFLFSLNLPHRLQQPPKHCPLSLSLSSTQSQRQILPLSSSLCPPRPIQTRPQLPPSQPPWTVASSISFPQQQHQHQHQHRHPPDLPRGVKTGQQQPISSRTPTDTAISSPHQTPLLSQPTHRPPSPGQRIDPTTAATVSLLTSHRWCRGEGEKKSADLPPEEEKNRKPEREDRRE